LSIDRREVIFSGRLNIPAEWSDETTKSFVIKALQQANIKSYELIGLYALTYELSVTPIEKPEDINE
jgi:hypothetical protein